jgi:sugar phosphate isomerase/epimerase
MMDLYLSLSAYGGVSTRQALSTIAAAGICHVELAIGVKPDADAAQAIQAFQSQGMTFRAHHAFVWEATHRPFNLAQPIDQAYFQQMIDWLVRMGITSYSVHPGSYGRNHFQAVAWQQFLSNLEWLHQLCRSRDIVLAVETMYPTVGKHCQHYFLDCLSTIDALQQAMPDLKWVLDLSHLNIWPPDRFDERLQVIDRLTDRLLEIHISDNDGERDIHTAITDQTWWLPWLDQLPKSVPYILEARLNHRSAQAIQIEYQRVQSYLAVDSVAA